MSGKFVFLTTLRHPSNTKNTEQIVKLLNMTISSALNQSYENVEMWVVCNEIPKGVIENGKVKFIAVELPSPGEGKANRLNKILAETDKGSKLLLGLVALKEVAPDFVFIIDSDDWIDSGVAQHVMNNKEVKAWYVNKGYLVDLVGSLRVRKSGLCRYCGTSYVYSYSMLCSLVGIKTLGNRLSNQEILEQADGFIKSRLLGDHRYQLFYFREHGIVMQEIPFRSVCWVVNTGENHSGTAINSVGLPFTSGFIMRFGLGAFLKPSKFKVSFIVKETIESIKSWFGWLNTDKKAKKV